MTTITRTLVVLLDFYGHPLLADDYTNKRRYSMLKRIAFRDLTKPCVIVSNHLDPDHEVLCELKRMIDNEERHLWINTNPDIPAEISDIVSILEKHNISIENVVIGGTNTSGCVVDAKPLSAFNWAEAGYRTEIWLPMCAEYQQPGMNADESNMIAFAEIYRKIQKRKLIDKVDITCKALPSVLQEN